MPTTTHLTADNMISYRSFLHYI